jgi:L-seryl-tRNA(Ser) seleniumtransferase
MPIKKTGFANIPSVDTLLQTTTIKSCVARYGPRQTRDKIREVLADLRQDIQARAPKDHDYSLQRLAAMIEQGLAQANRSTLVPVFNLTGTVIHTNLGRSPLAEQAIAAMSRVAGACNLEFELEEGKRGDRDDHVEKLICELTGAEAATIVNNNAAALVLVLNTLAKNKWVPGRGAPWA